MMLICGKWLFWQLFWSICCTAVQFFIPSTFPFLSSVLPVDCPVPPRPPSTSVQFHHCPVFTSVHFSTLSIFPPSSTFHLVQFSTPVHFSTLSSFSPYLVFHPIQFSTLILFSTSFHFSTFPPTSMFLPCPLFHPCPVFHLCPVLPVISRYVT